MRRVPLWLTFVPLLLGAAGYYWFWSGYAERFAAEVATVLPGVPARIGGFPYRIEATLGRPRLQLGGPVAGATLDAASAAATRGPWRPQLTVIRSTAPRMQIAVAALARATLDVTAAAALSSLHVEGRRLQRLSTVFDRPQIVSGLLPVAARADRLEVHLRETPAVAAAGMPTPPRQAQVVLTGTAVRFGPGAPLTLNADIGLTSPARLRSYAGWAAGGTVEVGLTLSDASGEVLRMAASGVPSSGALRLAGTIDTVCPAHVAAAFTGTVPAPEARARRPVRLAFAGTPGALRLTGAPPAGLATRTQLPPCPRLR